MISSQKFHPLAAIRCYRNAALAGGVQTIDWDAETFKLGVTHSTSANPSRITLTPGIWLIHVSLEDSDATNTAECKITDSVAGDIAKTEVSSLTPSQTMLVTTIFRKTDTSYITVTAGQAAAIWVPGTSTMYIEAIRLGDAI